MKKSLFVTLAFLALGLLPMLAGAATRNPLIESFTNDTWPYCPSADAVFENVIATYPTQAGGICYHVDWPDTSDPLHNIAAAVRTTYYSITGVPAGGVDGSMSSYSGWLSAFVARLGVSAPITITLSGQYSPILHNAYITAHVHCESTMTGTGHYIYVAITEDNLTSMGRTYNRVERGMNLNGWGEAFSISPGEDKDYNCTINYSTTWNTSNLKILCWVQAGQTSTKEVQNTKWESWSILSPATGVTPSTLGNIKANFH